MYRAFEVVPVSSSDDPTDDFLSGMFILASLLQILVCLILLTLFVGVMLSW